AGRSLHTVTQVVTIEAFAVGISADYGRFTAASAMLETTDRLTDEMVDPNQRGFLMLVGALRAMAEGRIPPPLVLAAVLLRTLAVSGWAPELRVCASCGAHGPHHALDIRAGGLVCTPCRRPGAIAVRQAAIEHMIFLLAGDWDNVLGAEDAVMQEAGRLITDTITWHLERSVRSLHYVERGARPTLPTRRIHARSDRPRVPGAASAPQRCAAPAAARSHHPRPRRGGHGRQRPLGEPAGAAPHGRARGGGGGAAGRGRRRPPDRRDPSERLRLLHRELEALPGRGALPDGLLPLRAAPPARHAELLGRAHR